MDSLRLNLSDWLARNVARIPKLPLPRRKPERMPGERDEAERAELPGAESGQPISSSEEPQQTGDVLEEYPGHPAPVEQVDALARAMTEDIWQDVLVELDDRSEEVSRIRLQLADHGWCDLIIGFVKVIEEFNSLLDEIPERAKKTIIDTVVYSSKKDGRAQLTEAVVGMIVDKAWGALKTAAIAHVPVLGVITSDELLRNLRMLAVFICPAPEAHEEVEDHAVDPLIKDVRDFVSDETKEWLAQQFEQWSVGVERQDEPERREGETHAVRRSPT
ncbi:hypothetical protein AB0M83_22995 [Amycolatopsis sp. NPDC051106]|uniref:hypothetical protein n=1 Tax=unclassified Amycolatopsis TaxID=2618356 RepID=UPI00341F01EA